MSRQVFIQDYSNKRPGDARQKMLARIHIEFPKLRPDLRHSTQELRLERLAFCETALGLKKPLTSMRRLTDKQLGRVIEAIKEQMPQRALPGCGVHHFKRDENLPTAIQTSDAGFAAEPGGAIHHLAGAEQVWAINRLFEHLGWSKPSQESFIKKRFNRASINWLAPKQANSLLMILLNIAASNDLKAMLGRDVAIKRAEIGRYIPQLKKKLGIDQGGHQ